MPRKNQFKNECSACGSKISAKLSREKSRDRSNTLCRKCFKAKGICVCGCGRTFPLYNGVGRKRQYFSPTCHRNIPEKVQSAREKRSAKLKAAWKRDDYRKSHTGENHHAWKGGWMYPPVFNKFLKKLIHVRDGNKCQNTKCPHRGVTKPLHVHHIDGDKMNCNLNNLITLCEPCHRKAHGKNPNAVIFKSP